MAMVGNDCHGCSDDLIAAGHGLVFEAIIAKAVFMILLIRFCMLILTVTGTALSQRMSR